MLKKLMGEMVETKAGMEHSAELKPHKRQPVKVENKPRHFEDIEVKDGKIVSDKLKNFEKVKITVQESPRLFEDTEIEPALLIECGDEDECSDVLGEIGENFSDEARYECDGANVVILSESIDVLKEIKTQFGGELVSVEFTEGYLDRGDEGSGPSGRRPKTKAGLMDRLPKKHIVIG